MDAFKNYFCRFPSTGECRAHQCDTYDMHFVPIDKYATENKGAKTEATFSTYNAYLFMSHRP